MASPVTSNEPAPPLFALLAVSNFDDRQCYDIA
jgi:hypothetical protein